MELGEVPTLLSLMMQAAGTFLIAALLFLLTRSIRRAYLDHWCAAWFCMAAGLWGLFFSFWMPPLAAWVEPLYPLGECAFGALLIAGCRNYATGAPLSRRDLRPALPALLAASLACCGGSGGAKPPREGASRVRAIEFVTYGTSACHSAALNRIAFARFDPAVIGGPDLSGRNDNTGTFELWLADASGANAACLTCADVPGGPRRNQHKGAPTWHPSVRWIVAAVEMPVHAAPHARSHAGTGAYVDLWALSPDGRQWFQLTRYANFATATRFPERPVGALIPRFSRSGRQLVWAEMIGYDEQHPFGIWRLAIADFVADALGPRLVNKITATPGASGTTFYEAWSFSPDDSLLTVASDSGAIHPGFMDVQVWSPRAGTLLNLTRTDDQYEEQAVFSPDGRLIAFMSTRGQTPAYDPSGDFWGTFRTDVWLMQADGRGAERLTYFNDPARPEYLPGAVNRGIPVCWTQDGASIYVDVAQNQGPVQTHETARIYRVFLNP